ncbi:Sec-independent protein translocase protein TatA [bacterium HR37]|nr:Sec-independent protein translocase protein TatA [bacterium HR37]
MIAFIKAQNMFGIGTSELLIILLIALLVFGPKEIPKIARTLGRGMRELQRAKEELRQTIYTEIEDEEEETTPKALENKETETNTNKDTKGVDSTSDNTDTKA